MDLSTLEIAIRLVVATFLSGVIGIERQFRHKPAGFRTNGLVGLGAALMTICGIQMAHVAGVDPTRIASIVVQGIGFLCAGVIIQQSAGAVHGITTAATLWIAAGIGIACGFGFWQAAGLATVLVFILLTIFDPLDARIEEEGDRKISRNRKK